MFTSRITFTNHPSVEKLLKMLTNSFYIMWVYRPSSEFEWRFIGQFDVMFDFVCPSKVSVVLGKDLRHAVQLPSDSVFPFWRDRGLTEVKG